MKKQTGLEMECFVHGALLLLLFRTVSAKQHDWWTKWQQGTVCAAMSSALSDRRKETGGSYESERLVHN